MNASHSTAPKGEKLANTQLENQWINFDWKKAEIFSLIGFNPGLQKQLFNVNGLW